MWITDRLVNLISGLGTGKDKQTATRFAFNPIGPGELESAYRSNWIARKIVDIPAFDMTRAWRSWQADERQIEAIEATEKRLRLQSKVARAKQLARLHGGAGIYLGTRDADQSSELVPERVGKDGLLYAHVFSRWELAAQQLIMDPLSPWFGEPEYYQLNAGAGGGIRIHPSRVIRFIGRPVTRQFAAAEQWGDSELQVVYDAVQQAGSSLAHVASMFNEAKTDVVSVPGLTASLATDAGTELLRKRFSGAALLKSQFNVLLLEGGDESAAEKWETRQIEFSGFPPLLQLYLKVVSGAADIPATRLLNDSPSGMQSTGDSDTRNYYDRLSAEQNVSLGPDMERGDEILIRSALGERPPEIHYRWNPLWQMSDAERSKIGLEKAQTSQIYVTAGLVPDEVMAKAVQNQLQEDGTYPGIEAAYDEYAAAMMTQPTPEDDVGFGGDPLSGGEPRDDLLAAEMADPNARRV